MRKLTQEQINKILEGHKHWLNEDCEGWETMRADFSYCDLRDVDLRYSDLRDVDLRYSDLCDVDLSCCNLRHANLCGAHLRGCILRGCILRGCILSCCNLRDVDLRYSDLCDVDLRGCILSHANLSDAKEVPYIPMVCPEEGDFIGWKKAGNKNKIVKLRIPEDALRSSATTRKCRCNKAEVVEIYNIDGTISDERIVSSDYDSTFTYEVGKTVEVQDFDTNRWEECTRGIHFYINRQEAINY